MCSADAKGEDLVLSSCLPKPFGGHISCNPGYMVHDTPHHLSVPPLKDPQIIS